MGCIVYTDYVYPAFVPLLADISCRLFLFRKCLFVVVCLLSLLFHHTSFFFFFFFFGGGGEGGGGGLLANSYPPLACLIRAAILHFSFRRHLFLDRGRVSEGLVWVSLAFHLFVVGTVIFASVLLCQVKSLELSQSMPKLISTTGSYWNGRIPVAISNFFFPAEIFGLLCTETVEAVMPKAVESYRDVTISLLLYNLRLQVNSWPKHARSRGYSGYFPCPFSRDILVLFCDS